jgi:ribonuclease G
LPEWLIERGIGETRMALVDGDEIVEARILLDGVVPAGTALRAALKRTGKPAIANVGGNEFLLPDGAPGLTEGQVMTIEVTREQIAGVEPWKRPLAKVTEGQWRSAELPVGDALSLPAAVDRLERTGWSDILEEARSGIIRFDGGELRVSATPAMTLIDVDGISAPATLAPAAARESARAILRHGIGGSIGIDLPTISGKAERKAVADAIDASLPKPFERTAMNGFGFVQIVRPRRHASMFELAQDRAAFEARALLRRVAFEPAGAKRIVAHPALVKIFEQRKGWIEELALQLGGAVELRADGALPMSGGYAESL